MRYYLVAGERSGDLHGSNLIKEISKLDKSANFRGVGGDEMISAGLDANIHYKELAFMGFLEVLLNLRTIRSFLIKTKEDIISYRPDVVILIDYGGFNLKLASFLHKKGIKVFYYITPKVWAWNQGRAYKIKRLVDRMFVILPFEKEFYKKFDWDVDYVGNPVLDAIKNHNYKEVSFSNNDKPIIAILPGSRSQELKTTLPEVKKVIINNPQLYFVIAKVNNLELSQYFGLEDFENVELTEGNTYDLLKQSKAAIVTSGTATLETALLKVPQVVIYKTSFTSYVIGKRLIKVGYISLVNLIADKPVVKELIQNDLNKNQLENELYLLIKDDNKRAQIIEDYNKIERTLDIGSASKNTAELIIKYLN
ncbi:lipid-A-disaccharide synthase [Fulvivirga lutea]|uniref:Lipid-A-disaccharide synthase n=1 Tax=Fulvivirga lutea TaxID=2810512 RepID=A0A975A0K0_9BACT|nr:lipid-A-disaccharide synthase [Fulvivirga lutea]QSE97285.1 lipid-A-disaccharide synthase [Fulvivirga lutea]